MPLAKAVDAMHYLVLESRPRSGYADTVNTYEFPARYLEHFAPLAAGEALWAVLYEPRRAGGRTAYVGWVVITGPPRRAPSADGRDLWQVRYATAIDPFPRLVPRLVNDEPVEAWLRPVPLALHPHRLQGRAVRPITADDFARILTLAGRLPPGLAPALAIEDRLRYLISVVRREQDFRERVVRAYDRTCAVSRFGSTAPAHAELIGSLVDAAHIRPIAHGGGDAITNGIALTPTLHRLFDAGYFTLQYRGDALLVRVSPHLPAPALRGQDSAFALALSGGQPVRLPSARTNLPDHQMLAYHNDVIFRR